MFEQNQNEGVVQSYEGSKASALIGILLILASILAYVFFVKQFVGQVSLLQDNLSAVDKNITEMEGKIKEYESAETQLDLSSEVQKKEVLKSVPDNLNQDGVIKDLIKISKAHDIKLNSLSFGKGVGKNSIGVLRINASFEGSYSDLISFLEGIEQNARLFVVDSVSVQVSKEEVLNVEKANFSLSIQAFFNQSNKHTEGVLAGSVSEANY
ncbi:type 4a pilus biogenesis protein PilO [Candidatus Peregrinibacteria bacterium]|nr:type 4a pilus biogenesis protein PilO [Candidatus Peregrinibacteria bacterium]